MGTHLQNWSILWLSFQSPYSSFYFEIGIIQNEAQMNHIVLEQYDAFQVERDMF